ncbi:MAG: adenylyltransferase/cytidyltransferase family protein [Lachnospiraceae bacterium]|nr:adenylyltransferase/cytidyltransferase family protein [Lachnospiraceae bacterium]
MKKVITYGTFDLLHYGHERLLKRAKALGDYLIVGVTSDEFDRARGKINVRQSVYERIENVRKLGIADEIIIESYEGQKIDDILKYGIDVIAEGSDWEGKFDYLKEYCEVVYLERTEGVSSSELRADEALRLGLVGTSNNVLKVEKEAAFVNGLNVEDAIDGKDEEAYEELLKKVDAVYIYATPEQHKPMIMKALKAGKHVLAETPLTLSEADLQEVRKEAKKQGVVLTEAMKTASSTAFNRLLLLLKAGKIGRILSVDATCTSLSSMMDSWSSLYDWGPTGLLPVFALLGKDYVRKSIVSWMSEEKEDYDLFTKIDFVYKDAVASVKVGNGVKSEGELIVSGEKGYAYVPAPWWKTEFFEIRFEDPSQNQRFFYQMEGEGIRYELVDFVNRIRRPAMLPVIPETVTEGIVSIMEDYRAGIDVTHLGAVHG